MNTSLNFSIVTPNFSFGAADTISGIAISATSPIRRTFRIGASLEKYQRLPCKRLHSKTKKTKTLSHYDPIITSSNKQLSSGFSSLVRVRDHLVTDERRKVIHR